MRKGRISNLDDSDKKDDNLSEGLEIVNLYKEKINEIRKERNHQKYIFIFLFWSFNWYKY